MTPRTSLSAHIRVATLLALCVAMVPLSSHVRTTGKRTSVASGGAVARLLTSGDPTRAEVRRRLAARSTDTYIGDILAERDSSLTRWPDRGGEPLTVWVQDQSDIEGWSSSYVDDVKDAFLEWDELDLPVRFAFADDSSHADVHVTFVDHFNEPISGRTKWARDEQWWITDADIILAV